MRHETQLVKCSTRGCSGHTGWGQLLAPCVWAGPQTLNSSAAWRGSSLLHRSAHKLAAQPSRRRVRGVKGLQKGQRSPQLGRRPPPAPPLLLRHQLHNLTVKKKRDIAIRRLQSVCSAACTVSAAVPGSSSCGCVWISTSQAQNAYTRPPRLAPPPCSPPRSPAAAPARRPACPGRRGGCALR